LTPGTNEKRYLAGAWDLRRGTIVPRVWWRKTHGLFLDLLATLDQAYPPSQFPRLYVVVDNYKIHKAQAVERWLARHPRFELLFLPTYCPKANPIEERPTDYTWSAPQTQQRARHLSLPPFARPNGRGYTPLPQGRPILLGHRPA
jgi:DDE superfamily endonuclease